MQVDILILMIPTMRSSGKPPHTQERQSKVCKRSLVCPPPLPSERERERERARSRLVLCLGGRQEDVVPSWKIITHWLLHACFVLLSFLFSLSPAPSLQSLPFSFCLSFSLSICVAASTFTLSHIISRQ